MIISMVRHELNSWVIYSACILKSLKFHSLVSNNYHYCFMFEVTIMIIIAYPQVNERRK